MMQAGREVIRKLTAPHSNHPALRLIFNFCALAAICLSTMAPRCSPVSMANGNKISDVPVVNGVKTVTYSTPSGGAVPQAAADAFAAWNSVAGTGVHFVPAPAGTVGTVTVGSSSTTDCIDTSGPGGTITYGPNFAPDLNNSANAADAKLSFEHEIGHLLGLGDNSSNSHDIMDQSTACTPADPGYSWDAVPPGGADGTMVGTCQTQEKGKRKSTC